MVPQKFIPKTQKMPQDSHKPEKTADNSHDHQVSSLDQDSVEGSKLVMAERLLVKELARQLAQKILTKIPREQLHNLLNELFSELKKY